MKTRSQSCLEFVFLCSNRLAKNDRTVKRRFPRCLEMRVVYPFSNKCMFAPLVMCSTAFCTGRTINGQSSRPSHRLFLDVITACCPRSCEVSIGPTTFVLQSRGVSFPNLWRQDLPLSHEIDAGSFLNHCLGPRNIWREVHFLSFVSNWRP